MPENTVNIRVPGAVDLTQYRVQVGDTVQFIEKINNTQADLENWAEQLTFCATDLQAAADQIGTRHGEVVQTGTQVAEDKDTVQQLRTETGQDRQAAEQAATTAGQHLTAAAQERQAAEQAATAAGQHLTVAAQERLAAEQAAEQAAQSAIEAGPTDLSVTRDAASLTIGNSAGNDAVLPVASSTEAGLMSAADKVVVSAGKGGFVKRTVFTSSGTWTPDPSTKFAIVEAIGGGGGGGAYSVQSTNANVGGGSGGQYLSTCIGNINGTGSATIIVGAGGAGGQGLTTSNRGGGSGGETSFTGYGVNLVAAGGTGGHYTSDYLATHRQPAGSGANNNVYKNVWLRRDNSNQFSTYPAGYGGGRSGPYASAGGSGDLDRLGGNGGMLSAGGGGGSPIYLGDYDYRGGGSAVAGSGGYSVCRYGSPSYGGHGQVPGGGGGAAGNYTTTLASVGGYGARGEIRVWEFK